MAIQSDAVLKFLTRVNQASRSRSKDVVLSMEDANALASALAATYVEHSDLMRRLLDAQSGGGNSLSVEMDGGGFR